jgi:hypothetical protein
VPWDILGGYLDAVRPWLLEHARPH